MNFTANRTGVFVHALPALGPFLDYLVGDSVVGVAGLARAFVDRVSHSLRVAAHSTPVRVLELASRRKFVITPSAKCFA